MSDGATQPTPPERRPGEAGSAGHGARRFGRRELLLGAAGGLTVLGLGGVAGYEWPHGGAPAPSPSPSAPLHEQTVPVGVQSFVTRPDLQPPEVRVTRHGSVVAPQGADASRYIFLAPRHDPDIVSQQGLMILDPAGRLVWFQPTPGSAPFDLNAQTYEGHEVLTWFQGRVTHGYGIGHGKMADHHYRHLMTINAGGGLRQDLHELNLTSRGTAFITAYEQTTADLSSVGGARKGAILAGHAQEIDLATGKVLFDWNSLDHIGVAESYAKPPKKATTLYDYFHINSISEMPDGNLLISSKNTWALYKVDRSSGAVLWRLNGKRSDFSIGPGAHFYWQHDSRMVGTNRLTVFDDGSFPPEERQSRGLLLSLDEAGRRVSLVRAYEHPAGFLAANQGSMQLLPDGHVFVGWGNQPYFSEFDAGGTLVLDGQFPVDVRSYRAYMLDWDGQPLDAPRAAAKPNPTGGTLVYASWNGSTRIARWSILAGGSPDALQPVGSEDWSGFETLVAVNSGAKYYRAVALDASGRELARSAPVTRGGKPG